MLDDTAAFEQSFLLSITLEHLAAQSAFLHTAQVGQQFLHLTCAVEHVSPAVIVEEERGVMEMRNARMKRPSLARVFGGINISLIRSIVGREIYVIQTVMVSQ